MMMTTTLMVLPFAANAQADMRKFTEYCLSPEHPKGKNKLRNFAAALGMTPTVEDAEALRSLALKAVLENEAEPGRLDKYGQRYTVDFEVERRGRRAVVRSAWILEHGSVTPKLTTCYVL